LRIFRRKRGIKEEMLVQKKKIPTDAKERINTLSKCTVYIVMSCRGFITEPEWIFPFSDKNTSSLKIL
jgi:uncharacterized protein YeeX (DUF496 family)